MDQRSLKPASSFANQYGVKAIVYGPPGSAKTPLVNTCPRPVLLACEPGLLSMRNSSVPTWQAYTVAAIEEFFAWFFSSTETKNFDTLAIDSISQMADIYLQDALKTNKHGLKAYGEMAEKTMTHLRKLYFFPQKHTYLICKEGVSETDGFKSKRPYFPGNMLNVDVPHMFDEILYLNIFPIPGVGQTKAFRCQGSIDVLARDRSGKLGEFEQPDFSLLVNKCMS